MENYSDKINTFYEKRGVKVIYNMLCHTPELVHTYVNNFSSYLKSHNITKSQHYKLACYRQMYNFEERQEYTGFENYSKLDRNFRKKIAPFMENSTQWTPTLVVEHDEINEYGNNYKEVLKNTLKKIDKPLLYLSGGLDSELVALAFIDAGVKFTPVIFNFVNDVGQTLNIFDFKWAYKLCQQHGLFPITKTINIAKLWSSLDFEMLAIQLNITSPQLVTHAYMIQLMSEKYRDYTHIFGGEVRFDTDFIAPDSEKSANLIYLNKASGYYYYYIDDQFYGPPGWGLARVSTYISTGGVTLGEPWDFYTTRYAENFATYDPWYNVTTLSPSPTWYVRVSNVNVVAQIGPGSATWNPVTPNSYTTITSSFGTQLLCETSHEYAGGPGNIIVEYTISIYGSTGGVGTAASGIIAHEATNGI